MKKNILRLTTHTHTIHHWKRAWLIFIAWLHKRLTILLCLYFRVKIITCSFIMTCVIISSLNQKTLSISLISSQSLEMLYWISSNFAFGDRHFCLQDKSVCLREYFILRTKHISLSVESDIFRWNQRKTIAKKAWIKTSFVKNFSFFVERLYETFESLRSTNV